MVIPISPHAHIATGTVIEHFLSKPHATTHKIGFSRNLVEVLGVKRALWKQDQNPIRNLYYV